MSFGGRIAWCDASFFLSALRHCFYGRARNSFGVIPVFFLK